MSSRIHVQRKTSAAEPAATVRAAQQDGRIANSPALLAQRKQLASAFGPAAQLKEPDEELQAKAAPEEELPAQAKAEPNRTGMPDSLKSGIESLSGMDMSDVRVHTASPEPAQLNALAFAQGNDIHVAPGQEKHVPHEAWHVVQQRQGRVQPTMDVGGTAVNDDPGLEREADQMGSKAMQLRADPAAALQPRAGKEPARRQEGPVQRMIICYMQADLVHGAPRGPFDDEIIGQVIYQRPSGITYTGSDGTNSGSIKHYVPYNWIVKNLIDWHIEGKSRKAAAVSLSLVLARLKIQPPALPREPLVASYNAWVDEVVTSICDWEQNLFKDEPSSGDHKGTALDTPSSPVVLARVQNAYLALGDLAKPALA